MEGVLRAAGRDNFHHRRCRPRAAAGSEEGAGHVVNIVFLGLDNAGKTTLLYMLQSDRFTQTDSTVHPHQAEVTIGNIRFNSYDWADTRRLGKHGKSTAAQLDGIIFIIDAADRERLPEAKKELDTLLEMSELQTVPFVVFGNKIDKKESLKEEELREYFGLHFHSTMGKDPKQKNPGARPIEVFMCSVAKRVGYSDGFQWLSNFIK
eukprot:CAMPEP_0202977250 /NCGR_PEP_ID=MMETSP1396-20130829/84145_1 /ASSEMBLY_ACC=CAM_ASM_000872 /TAXON_ID= /ORGANISM="Pseudokeronopsis sp., Strain Brazil" /LENGTH=206 /DNA_ID=CAMNT_0049715973 /DNA_START=285 /DNA_END=905 /DNA_ORIENTATION=-